MCRINYTNSCSFPYQQFHFILTLRVNSIGAGALYGNIIFLVNYHVQLVLGNQLALGTLLVYTEEKNSEHTKALNSMVNATVGNVNLFMSFISWYLPLIRMKIFKITIQILVYCVWNRVIPRDLSKNKIKLLPVRPVEVCVQT